MKNDNINPLLRMDYPDPDVIRVGDTYYMVSTTMYFMPGCEILRSYDLRNWEHAAFVYERLDSTPAQRMEDGKNIYGQGMWAASLRWHEDCFYVIFVANDTQKTYLYRSKSIEGPWEKSEIEGFYHDNSLLFDDDGRVYIVYGNRDIHLTELEADLSGPKKGGLDRVILVDRDDAYLGYEGAHFYKINGKYYIFFIHMPKATARRTESCFVADSLEGEFRGGDVCGDDRGYCGSGVAQGGIVDTPEGDWYAILFQDSGAVGRIPILLPVHWKEGEEIPVFGEKGRVPESFPIPEGRPGYVYEPLAGSDDFKDVPAAADTEEEYKRKHESFGFKSRWQFNHEPELKLISRDTSAGTVRISTDRLSKNLVQAKNILTQRSSWPDSAAEVTVDASGLKEGDYAGLCLLESAYAFIALTRREGELWLVMKTRKAPEGLWGERNDETPGDEQEAVKLKKGSSVRLRAEADFMRMKDTARLHYIEDGAKKPLGGEAKLVFKLDHFTGVRFGLFVFSTREAGGSAVFSDFAYEKQEV
ncbi:MAG: family 43 glycosylhydrolase [Lachnospiraceae bacterium]|nr:family 43 glycosylhydrolase [Lachnospiraceae bacterium]